MNSDQPFVIGIGGTTKPESSTERALTMSLEAVAEQGIRTELFGGAFLVQLPHYGTEESRASPQGRALVRAFRAADGIILASPGYHGSISGLVKNAIDYAEELAGDARSYLDGIPVGLIATAYGWQAATGALAALRSIVHALRGWPTPLGAVVNCSGDIFQDGRRLDDSVVNQLVLVGWQVNDFVWLRRKGFDSDLARVDHFAVEDLIEGVDHRI